MNKQDQRKKPSSSRQALTSPKSTPNETTAVPASSQQLPPSASITPDVLLKRLPPGQQAAAMLQMGRTQGNRHVQRVVEAPVLVPQPITPALTVSDPNEPAEQEAETVANEIMRTSALPPPADPNDADDDGKPTQPHGIQRAASRSQGGTVGPDVAERVADLQGKGSPLPASEQQFFAERFGKPVDHVRVHNNNDAIQLSRDLHAHAFTVGNDIAFNAGAYQPGTQIGRKLLAHEITHTFQQTGGVARQIQRAPAEGASLSVADAVEKAKTSVTDSEVAAEHVEPLETKPADLEAPVGGEGGGAAAAGSAGGGAAAQAAPAPDAAPAEGQAAQPGAEQAVAAEAGAPQPTKEGKEQAGPDAKEGNEQTAEQAAAEQQAGEEQAPAEQPATAEAAAPAEQPVAGDGSAADAKQAEAQAAAQTKQQSNAEKAAAEQPAEAQQKAGAEQTAAEQTTPDQQQTAAEQAQPATEQTAAAEQPATEQATAQQTPDVQRAIAPTPIRRSVLPGLVIQRAVAAPSGVAPKSAEADPAFKAVTTQAKAAGKATKQHDPAAKKAAEAATAAKMPAEEKKGKAQDQQACAVEAEAASQEAKAVPGSTPGFDKASFVASVRTRITELTPQDPQKMENPESSGVFEGAKAAVDQKVQTGKDQADGKVEDTIAQAPNTAAVPDKQVTPLQPNAPGTKPAIAGAEGAAPKPKGQSEVEDPLNKENEAIKANMEAAKVTPQMLDESGESRFVQASNQQKEADQHVKTDPASYRNKEQSMVEQAKGDAKAQAETGVDAMHGTRADVFGQMDGLQSTTVGKDEGKRAEIGKAIDGIYQATKTEVESILSGLDGKVDAAFNAGAGRAKSAAVDYIKRETQAYKDRRYAKDEGWLDNPLGKLGGAVNQVGDFLTDMPPEYYEYYNKGRDLYLAEMETVINEVADIVGEHLGRAKARIATGKQEIQDYVAKQPKELREVAEEAANEATSKFDSLEQTVDAKQEELVNTLAQKYNEHLASIDSELEQMREADKGLLAKAKDAITGVIQTIQELKAMLQGVLSRAAGVIDKIIANPMQFLGNLITGVKQGLTNFMTNIGTHLQGGLISWLTGAVAGAGLRMPPAFDLPGIFDLVLQVLGLTYDRIRGQVVKALGPQGEQVVGALEQSWEIFQIIQTQGMAGLWQYVSGMIGDLKTMVMEEIKSMIANEVIKAGIQWLIGILGGPAGAFIKAVQAIVNIVMWFINNGSRLMGLVNSVLDSVSAIANGDIGGAAAAVERSLAQAVPTVISFLADLLGLGGIAKRVQGIFHKVQEPINKAINWVIQKAKAMAKKVLGFLGLGGKNKPSDPNQPVGEQAKVGDVGDTISFSAKGESHRLWVETAGGAPTIMVASTQMPAEARLAQWEGQLPDLLSSKREDAQRLIGSARTKLATTQREAQEATNEKKQAETATNSTSEVAEFNQADQETVTAEQALAGDMGQLFTIFDDQESFRPTQLRGKATPTLDRLEVEEAGVTHRYVNEYRLYVGNGGQQDILLYVEGRAARKLGKRSEGDSIAAYVAAGGVGGSKNNRTIEMLDANGKVRAERIPDIFVQDRVVGDVKNVQTQSLDEQMRDNVMIAQGKNARLRGQTNKLNPTGRFDLVVRAICDKYPEGTHVSEPLKAAVAANGGSVYEVIS